MAGNGHVHKLNKPPEFYFVDDQMHVVDRVDGHVVCHRIYPIELAVPIAARFLEIMEGAAALKPHKRRKRLKLFGRRKA